MPSNSKTNLFLRHAAQVVTPQESGRLAVDRPSLLVTADGAIIIRDRLIAALGTTTQLENSSIAKDCQVIDLTGCVVAPGFVDSHTHLVFAATRHEEYEMRIRGASYESIAASGGGIRNSVRRLRALSEEELFHQARFWCSEFLRYGTTTIEAKSGYGLDLENEIKILHVLKRLNEDRAVPLEIVPTFLGAHEIPDEYRRQPGEYVDLVCDVMIPRVARENLAEFCDVFCEQHVFSVDQSRRILSTAKQFGMKQKIHADQLTHNGGARLAAELGATSADHLEYIDDTDIGLLAESHVTCTILPGASFHLGKNIFAPARKLLNAGATLALATDFNPGTSPSVNMQTILAIAGSSLQMTPEEAMIAATAGGAHALARSNRLGSLGLGMQADITIFAVDDYRRIPYHYGMNLVRGVIKRGEIIFLE